jgi:hypothetical protein
MTMENTQTAYFLFKVSLAAGLLAGRPGTGRQGLSAPQRLNQPWGPHIACSMGNGDPLHWGKTDRASN